MPGPRPPALLVTVVPALTLHPPAAQGVSRPDAAQRRRLKALHWDKLKATGEGTVWRRAAREQALRINITELEALFQARRRFCVVSYPCHVLAGHGDRRVGGWVLLGWVLDCMGRLGSGGQTAQVRGAAALVTRGLCPYRLTLASDPGEQRAAAQGGRRV